MARIAGVDLPRTKRVEIGLTYIFGIGRTRSNAILNEAGVSPDIRVKDLSEDDVRKLSRVIEEQGGVEGDLRVVSACLHAHVTPDPRLLELIPRKGRKLDHRPRSLAREAEAVVEASAEEFRAESERHGLRVAGRSPRVPREGPRLGDLGCLRPGLQ